MSAPLHVADWTGLPLGHAEGEGGRCLIEASAGTGKTWTIAALYLRLLLEQGLMPRQVVVTTFTDAAAQELRERLRAKLRWAERRALDFDATRPVDAAGLPSDEAWLHRRWRGDPARASADALRLRLAQSELDLAPVGTLHGLCRRVLDDYPFESGGAFRLGEMVSGKALENELIEDLWRELAQSEGELPPGDLAWWRGGFDALARALREAIRPDVRVQLVSGEAIDAVMRPENAALIRAWVGDGAQFNPRAKVLRRGLLALADYIEAGDRSASLDAGTVDDLAAPPEKQIGPEHLEAALRSPAMALAREAARVLADVDLPARSAALARWRERLLAQRDARLRERDLVGFDELVAQVRRALAAPGGALAERLFRAWPVALVDEFQDTDAQQYAILDAIYRDAGGRKRGRLVMIGDPKQAIYRFRGGDIHAYLHAARSADAVLRLAVNFRSSGALVRGFNALYAQAGPALSQYDDAIAYEAVRAGRELPPLRMDGRTVERPLVLHLLREPPPNKGERERQALDACANHLVHLLSGDVRIGDEPLRPGDLAVLLPTNGHVAALRERLQRRGVPCVGAGRSSVFATGLARELQVILYAVEHRGEEGALRAALATRLLGLSLAELRALRERPDAWLRHEQRFARWRLQWQREGVLAVVQSLLGVAAPALLAAPDGERALTDLRHLGELLQEAEQELHGAEQLLGWLAAQREGGGDEGDAAEEQQLRIESDARRVRLMTLHASKGLEFPVVLLPLMWAHEGRDIRLPLRHAADGGRELVLGGADHAAACEEAAREDQDERFRVLYVALTRARLACHVYVLPPERRANGNTQQPLGDPKRSALDATVGRLLRAGIAASDALDWREDDWPWPFATLAPAREAQPRERRALPLPPARPARQVYSFSNLAHAQDAGTLEDLPADDEAATPAPEEEGIDALPAEPRPAQPHPELLALSSWRGPEFGNALHAIFENRKPGEPMAQQLGLVRRSLRGEGVRSEDAPEPLARRLAARVQAVLDAELLPGLALGTLPAAAMRAEMAFHYALDEVSMARLREACERHGEPALVPRAPAATLRGLMTGKIDLVFEHAGRFHVLDYKSNWLGESLAGYLPERLGAAMDAHRYRFQALLYTVAVERLLRQRLPRYERERHLGEAIYLFVRAVGLAPGAGVWRHRFGGALLDAADRALGASRGEAA